MRSRFFSLPVIFSLLGGGILTTAIMALGLYFIVVPKLPAIDSLKEVQFQVPLRIFTRDEELIAEFGEKKRSPLKIDNAPKQLIDAILAAEDDRFYEHPGVDYKGLLRAVFYLLKTGEKGQGGSTITMQVARNFFLSREKTYLRKLNEILLALKIERELSKGEILELYMNKIYLGNRSYGFAAASKVYYGTDVHNLTAAQAAMIAGLPKAPSRYNPIVNPKRALVRRDYVLGRMVALGSLTYDEHQEAINSVDQARLHRLSVELTASYVAEMVRAEMVERFGSEAYTGGYQVYTSIDSRLQKAANAALNQALREYDERHGYRGPEATVTVTGNSVEQDWLALLAQHRESNKMWPALVIEIGEKTATVYQPALGKVALDWEAMSWASPWRGDGLNPGPRPRMTSEIIQVGDIIRISEVAPQKWRLVQVPTVEGALVSLSPNDGSLIALVGGFNFSKSKFNRVIQAERQPGSNLKPFIYSSAIEKGFTAASLINDAPVVFDDAGLESTWRPENYSGRVFGPTRLREALVKSRNLVSIRVLRATGIGYTIKYLQRFGFKKQKLPRDLSLALGSAAITPMELVTGYATFANGGYKVEPYFIDRIESAAGDVIFQADPATVCPDCEQQPESTPALGQDSVGDDVVSVQQTETIADGQPINGDVFEVGGQQPLKLAKQVISPQNVYIMTSIMREVIERGTGRRARQLGRHDLAGKTGTTNDQRDAWFSGFNSEVVTTAWVGFDEPKTLGDRETGGRAALPMWISYMREALKDLPERPLGQPPGLVTVRVDPESGLPVSSSNPNGLFEIFRAGHVPERGGEYTAGPDTGLEAGATAPNLTEPQEIPEEQLF